MKKALKIIIKVRKVSEGGWVNTIIISAIGIKYHAKKKSMLLKVNVLPTMVIRKKGRLVERNEIRIKKL